jgi:hypothetical protein
MVSGLAGLTGGWIMVYDYGLLYLLGGAHSRISALRTVSLWLVDGSMMLRMWTVMVTQLL